MERGNLITPPKTPSFVKVFMKNAPLLGERKKSLKSKEKK